MGRVVAGIDYSLTSPALCVCLDDENVTYDNCKFYYLTDKKKFDGKFGKNILGVEHQEYFTEQQRYSNIADWIMMYVKDFYKVQKVYIEGYSMGSKGRVFHIAENTAILKDRLWCRGIEFDSIAPTAVKKIASGKGNANKELMQETFIQETGINVKNLLGQTENSWNPSGDIIDAFYICKAGVELENASQGT